MFTIIENRPDWLKGAITKKECLFINAILQLKKARNVLEIGVASGFSSAVILKTLQQINKNDSNFKLTSFDNTEYCYFDKTKKTGIHLYETLPDLITNFELIHSTTASIDKCISNQKFDVCFIDANHKHPYPAMDLLFTLDFMHNDAIYILHDINLANNKNKFQKSKGPFFLFYGLLGSKFLGEPNLNRNFANIGSWIIPPNFKRQKIKKNLIQIIEKHAFEQNLDVEYREKYNLIKSKIMGVSKAMKQ